MLICITAVLAGDGKRILCVGSCITSDLIKRIGKVGPPILGLAIVEFREFVSLQIQLGRIIWNGIVDLIAEAEVVDDLAVAV